MSIRLTKTMKHIVVYCGAVLVTAALASAAVVYSRASQARIQQSRADADSTSDTVRLARIKVGEVFYVPLVDTLWAPGAVEAIQDIDLATKLSGRVEEIAFREGDAVRKGDVLLRLDLDDLQAEYAEAQTDYDLAYLKYKRTERLLREEVASTDSFDDAQAEVKRTSASLRLVSVRLDYGTLLSPIDGFLDRLPVDVGEHIDIGQTVMKVVNIDRVEVMVDIPEKDSHYFKRGQSIRVLASNGEEREFTGVIDFVALTADPDTRTYPAKIIVENTDHWLRPGMIVRAEMVRRRVAQAIAIPFFATVDREEGRSVYVVEDGVARERSVTLGAYQGGLVEVLDGLEVGDRLAIVGQRDLVDGAGVEIEEDVTEFARAYQAGGGDLSQLALEILN